MQSPTGHISLLEDWKLSPYRRHIVRSQNRTKSTSDRLLWLHTHDLLEGPMTTTTNVVDGNASHHIDNSTNQRPSVWNVKLIGSILQAIPRNDETIRLLNWFSISLSVWPVSLPQLSTICNGWEFATLDRDQVVEAKLLFLFRPDDDAALCVWIKFYDLPSSKPNHWTSR